MDRHPAISGLTNHDVDPDSGTDNTSTVTLDHANPINLDQDFGYRDPPTRTPSAARSGQIPTPMAPWPARSGWFQGVTVVLRDANGDIVATTTTDASGNYSFTNLPDGTYHGRCDR